MRKYIAISLLGAVLASPAILADTRNLDPIFQVTPVGSQPDSGCFENSGHNRNPIWSGITSVPGQTIIGGLIGAVVGDQFGSGTGNDIATGVGVAAGAAAGAYNANRMEQNRIRECQQYRGYANSQRMDGQYVDYR